VEVPAVKAVMAEREDLGGPEGPEAAVIGSARPEGLFPEVPEALAVQAAMAAKAVMAGPEVLEAGL
jgi:hypothetical protein